ncbi:hypothetical protein JTE90_017879 [Oedothorax gibbosus]|uniref:Uncharacterized protein n=1 Tax=Oedothorax gibbosus TaxID=931172 RepID=A0AAV6V1J6_9ARAC|nr:hypothetical protein JTE90_017879 [Oedothorax gibbosus]
MEDTSILSHYIPCKYIDARSLGMADNDPRKEIFDNAFERLSSGPTVTEITAVNHQLYKVSCEIALENYDLKKKLKAMEARMKETENL